MWRRLLDSETPNFRLPLIALAGYSVVLLYMTSFGGGPDSWEVPVAQDFIRGGTIPEGGGFGQQMFRILFWPTLIAALAFRLAVIVSGPLRYRRVLGRPLAVDALTSIVGANAIGVLALPLLLGATNALPAVERWVATHVPTLFVVPAPVALLAANVVGGFAYYWWHRLQHVWRPLWLLTHRIHHLPPQLTIASATPTEDPLGGLFSFVPRALILGSATKMFSAEPMVPEAFLWSVLSWTAFEVVNHDEPSYRWTIGGPCRRFGFALLGGGAWHIMHHSARPGHEAVNLGGFPFQIWDRLFGTYVAPETEPPPIGLTGRPRLWRTPLRIALAGWAQVLGELWRNRGLATWARILLGPSTYRPPHAVYVLTHPGAFEPTDASPDGAS